MRYDRDGPLPRPPELRGQFRWAFRAVAASFLDGDGLRRVEAEFWGGRPSEGKDLRPSPVSVRLRRGVGEDDVEEGGRCARRRRRYRITIDEDGRLRVDNRCYLCPPIYLRGRREEQPLVIRAGATFELELTGLREDALEVAKLSLELLSLIGGYGRRFRRAFGCFEVRADDLSTRVEGTDDFVDRLRGCLDDLRELIAERSDGTSGPVESFPSFRRATLWTFEWRKQRVDKLLDRLGGTLREARRRLRNERFENSNEELRWLLGSSDAGGPLAAAIPAPPLRDAGRARRREPRSLRGLRPAAVVREAAPRERDRRGRGGGSEEGRERSREDATPVVPRRRAPRDRSNREPREGVEIGGVNTLGEPALGPHGDPHPSGHWWATRRDRPPADPAQAHPRTLRPGELREGSAEDPRRGRAGEAGRPGR
ncbi:RAMP superfamily CRISPR-associated protein [Methanopyrus kandleri]|uniref:RAMP superfamily CRISPR-associated protein n=1 Tax=Methanopyrus kandleri TaxID=2320 RepID=UPI002FF497A7